MFRNLWDISKDMPKGGPGQGGELDPLRLAPRLQTALQALYGHYAKTFQLWEAAGIKVPPCFIIVCQNTSISKLVYDFVSGFHRKKDDGRTTLVPGRLALDWGGTAQTRDASQNRCGAMGRDPRDSEGSRRPCLVPAMHSAHLARARPDARVLLTTFSDTLAHALHTKLKRPLGNEPRLAERIDVHSLEAIGLRLYKTHIGQATIASCDHLRELMSDAMGVVDGGKFSLHFLMTEWEHVVEAWQLENWEGYRDVARLGRKTRLPEAQRAVLWSIFERVRAGLKTRQLITHAALFSALAAAISRDRAVVFDYVVVDEAQDISVAHLRFLAALGGGRPNALFFAGDLGQRIVQQPFSWKALGVDIRGRSRTLRVNYRTSHQIRTQADRLLGLVMTGVDGNGETRSDAVSVFNGAPPTIRSLKSESEESMIVGDWIAERAKAGVLPHEFGVFVRSGAELDRARAAVERAGMAFTVLDDHVETTSGHVSISTMQLAKGLEFRAVAVMACDDEIVPLQERIEMVGDDADLQEVYESERHLLYVACTRARDHLLVTSVEPASEFVDDMLA
jgi:superfamily I DNA/RNA helicase